MVYLYSNVAGLSATRGNPLLHVVTAFLMIFGVKVPAIIYAPPESDPANDALLRPELDYTVFWLRTWHAISACIQLWALCA